MFEVLELGGTLLVIVIMIMLAFHAAGLAERLYIRCKVGLVSTRTTTFQRREIFVNFADLVRQESSISDSAHKSAAMLSGVAQ